MTRLAAFILVLSLALPAFGQTRVSGPLTGKRDRLVRLQLDDTANIKSAIWRVFPANGVDLEKTGPFSCVLAGKPGQYDVWCVWTTLDGSIGDAAHSLTIEDGGPLPPTPVPPNPPTPPVPPTPSVDKWGLIKIARETAPANADERAKVKANFSAVASQLAAGGFSNVAAARTKLSELNRAAVGAVTAGHPWDRFFMSVGTAMDAAEKAGTVKATGDYVQAWSDISQGL